MITCISSIPKPTLGPRLKFISQIYECLMYKANHIPRTNHLQYVHPPQRCLCPGWKANLCMIKMQVGKNIVLQFGYVHMYSYFVLLKTTMIAILQQMTCIWTLLLLE